MKHTEHNNEEDPIALKIADIPVRNTQSMTLHPTELTPEQPPQYLHILSSYPPALPLNSFHLQPPSLSSSTSFPFHSSILFILSFFTFLPQPPPF